MRKIQWRQTRGKRVGSLFSWTKTKSQTTAALFIQEKWTAHWFHFLNSARVSLWWAAGGRWQGNCARPGRTFKRRGDMSMQLPVFTTSHSCHLDGKLQISIWMNATLKDLTSLAKEAYLEARRRAHTSVLRLFLWIWKDPGAKLRRLVAPFMAGRHKSSK